MERCDECGFEYELALAPTAGAAIVATGLQLAKRVGRDVDELRHHLRDVERQLAGDG